MNSLLNLISLLAFLTKVYINTQDLKVECSKEYTCETIAYKTQELSLVITRILEKKVETVVATLESSKSSSFIAMMNEEVLDTLKTPRALVVFKSSFIIDYKQEALRELALLIALIFVLFVCIIVSNKRKGRKSSETTEKIQVATQYIALDNSKNILPRIPEFERHVYCAYRKTNITQIIPFIQIVQLKQRIPIPISVHLFIFKQSSTFIPNQRSTINRPFLPSISKNSPCEQKRTNALSLMVVKTKTQLAIEFDKSIHLIYKKQQPQRLLQKNMSNLDGKDTDQSTATIRCIIHNRNMKKHLCSTIQTNRNNNINQFKHIQHLKKQALAKQNENEQHFVDCNNQVTLFLEESLSSANERLFDVDVEFEKARASEASIINELNSMQPKATVKVLKTVQTVDIPFKHQPVENSWSSNEIKINIILLEIELKQIIHRHRHTGLLLSLLNKNTKKNAPPIKRAPLQEATPPDRD